jgi:hypothetical protein
MGEVHQVFVARGEAGTSRVRAVLIALATAVVLLATAAVIRRAGSPASRGLASSYESAVFPTYHDSRLAPAWALRSLDSHRAFASAVFPKYSAFVNGGDESGLGRSVLRRDQSDADRWMRADQRDWLGRGAEYLDAGVGEVGQAQVQGEQLAVRGQVRPAGGAGAALARAEAAAVALSRPSAPNAAELVRVRRRPAASARGVTDQKLYIPAIYNDKIDPEQEMEDMMEEFSAIIKQITELQAQMECAARCSNSTVNETTLNLDGNTLDVTFDDSHKNVSGGVLAPAEDDEAAMACLEACGIDAQILNATQQAEISTRSRLHAILRAVASEKAKMTEALRSARASKQRATLAAETRPMPASASAHASLSPKEKTAALVRAANSYFGHTMANARQVQVDAAAAHGHFFHGKWVDEGEVHAVEPRDRASARARDASKSAQALRHAFEYRLTQSQSDEAARAWQPAAAPKHATAAQVATQAAAQRVAAPISVGAQEQASGQQQSLLQVGARMVRSSRSAGAAKVQRWLEGRKDGGQAQLVDWSLDLPGLDKLGTSAGSSNTAADLLPLRDTIRHTVGEYQSSQP